MLQEDESIELKEVVVDAIKKEVVAFANSKGGTIYVGVRDDGTVIGLSNADAAMQQAANMVRDAIKPDVTMFVQYDFELLDGTQVLAIRVNEGTNKPYYLTKHGLKPAGVFVRQGAASVSASDEQIRRMIRDTDGDSFETMRSLNQHITLDFTAAQFAKRSLTFGATQLQTLGLCDAGGLYTNAALLLSEQNPFTIKCAVFADDGSEFQDRKEFRGSLLQQLSEVYDYLDARNRLGSTFEGLYRIDTRDYPEAAIREALLNSLVHRDYSYSASTLVSLYADRLEFVSVGGLLPGITLADVQLGLSVCRNKTLADIFYRLTLIEAYGTGLRKIQSTYKDCERKPELLATPNAFKIILPNMNAEREKRAASARHAAAPGELLLREPDALFHTETARSRPQSTYLPAATGAAYYVATDNVPPHTDDEAVRVYAQEHATFTRAEIDRLLGVSPATANRLLKRLVAAGTLTARGNGKALRYSARR